MRRALVLFLPLLISAQDFSNLKIEKVSGNHQFTEGPAWSPEGYLLFCDVPANSIVRLDPKGKSVYREASGGASGLAFDQQGRVYAAESRARRITRTDKKGKVEVLADSWQGKKLNAPNDITVSRNGHVYFTDPAFGKQDEGRELPYSIYHITPKGDMELAAAWETRPNGLALSADGKTLYVANADERSIHVFDIGKDGRASNQRVAVSGIEGPPDGVKLDEKGNLYVAAGGLVIYSPEGKLLQSLPMTEKPSNCVFDGAETLYVTARSSVYRVRLEPKGAPSH